MPGCVSCQLYLLFDVLENFDISGDIKFSNTSRSIYSQQETHAVIIFYISSTCTTFTDSFFPSSNYHL